MSLGNGVEIMFLPLVTNYHLTNYKPDFMLALLDGPARGIDALYYLDPDICVTARWRCFEDWIGCGVALCEDVNSPLPENHPRRVGWRRYYAGHGLRLRYKSSVYVNGGLVGVAAADRRFLETWKQTMDLMGQEIGSLSLALTANSAYRSTGFADCFDRTDQDALNAALEASPLVASIIGQEAMGFKPGLALVPHALGGGKPWVRSYLRAALNGVAPRLADRAFWMNVSAPLAPFNRTTRLLKRLDIMAAAAIGRFFSRA